MTAARWTSRALQTRPKTSSTLRFVCLLFLFLALLYTHGLSAESVAHHSSGGVSSATISVPHVVTDDDDHILPAEAPSWLEASKTREESASETEGCLAVRPAAGLDLPVWCESPPDAVRPLLRWSALAVAHAGASVADSRRSIGTAVLRI